MNLEQTHILLEVREHRYTLANLRLHERVCHGSKEKIMVHSKSQTNFLKRLTIFQNRHGLRSAEPTSVGEVLGTDIECPRISPVKNATRLMVDNVRYLRKKRQLMIIPIMKVAYIIVIVMTQHQRYWKEKIFFSTTKLIDIMITQKGLISF